MFEDSGLQYERDVEPWLGSEVAIGVLPSAVPDGLPHPVLLIESDDDEAAKKAMTRLEESDDGLPGPWRLVDEFVVMALDGDAKSIDAVVEEVEREGDGLSGSDKFNGVVDALHGDRLVLGYVDGERALDALADYSGALDEIPFDMADVAAGPVAFDLHAAEKALVMEAVTRGTGKNRGQRLDFEFPAGTVASLSFVGLADALRGAAAQVPPEALAEMGVDLEDDFLSWIGDRATFVVGATGQDLPNIGVIIEVTDRDKAAEILPLLEQALAGGVAGALGIDPSSEDAAGAPQASFELQDDQLLIGFPTEYVATLATVKPAAEGEPAVFDLSVDMNALAEMVDEPEVAEVLERITARAGRDGQFDRFTVRVEFG